MCDRRGNWGPESDSRQEAEIGYKIQILRIQLASHIPGLSLKGSPRWPLVRRAAESAHWDAGERLGTPEMVLPPFRQAHKDPTLAEALKQDAFHGPTCWGPWVLSLPGILSSPKPGSCPSAFKAGSDNTLSSQLSSSAPFGIQQFLNCHRLLCMWLPRANGHALPNVRVSCEPGHVCIPPSPLPK